MLAALALCATLLLILSPLSSNAQNAPLYVFGDSLYDTGMTLYVGVEGAGAEFWPYGETYFKRPAGRYSDGRLIPDFLAEYAGLPFLQPYLLPGLNALTYRKGINFASAGACILVETRPHVNLKQQTDYFLQMVRRMKIELGFGEAKKVVASGVYLYNIGANDYYSLVHEYVDKPPLSSSAKELYMDIVLGNLTTHIRTVYNQGGRKFAFQNIGPLGCMPSMKCMLGSNGTCLEGPLELARMHNARFLDIVKNLESELPGFKYSIYDFYSSLSTRYLYGSKYGFRETNNACCGSGEYNGEFSCQKKEETFSVCSNPRDYLWFDAAHPNEKANEQFSREFWSGDSDLVTPINLQTLFSL